MHPSYPFLYPFHDLETKRNIRDKIEGEKREKGKVKERRRKTLKRSQQDMDKEEAIK